MNEHEEYSGPERRRETHLTESQIEEIATRAADKAVKKMADETFKAVGKTVVEKLFWVIGVVFIGGYLWLQSLGKAPPIVK